MKRTLPYIILFVIVAAIAALLFTGDSNSGKKFDQRITLKKKDKIPYGTNVAFENLRYIFPKASISVNKQEPGYWDSLSNYNDGQALIIIAPQINADEYEMKKLIRFIENGNDVFISARTISAAVQEILDIETSPINTTEMKDWKGDPTIDRLYLQLTQPAFKEKAKFTYDGEKFNAWVLSYDSTTTDILGTDDTKRTNFIHLKAGKGNLYLHVAPLAFSNYFLLHDNNMKYYENVMSVISPEVKKVVWDEFYLNKKYYYEQNKEGKKSWMSVLFQYKSLMWALLIAMLTLLLYVLMEMRRKQRFIPVVKKPKNDSLDFVKTIGRLYYEKGDNLNLCRKMASYFLEHVRNKYKLATGTLDEEFIKKLQFKTGTEENEIRGIVSSIRELNAGGKITDKQVADFHKKLEAFYGRS